MAASARELVFKIIGNNEQFNKTIEDTNKRLDDFKKKTKDANELFSKVSKQSAIATSAIAALGVAAAKLAVDFNEGFGKVQTLIPGATERVQQLQENILTLSPAVGKTTKDLTDGLYEVISAFGDSAESAKNLEVAAKGATAGGATTKEAIQLLSAVTKGYGNTSNEAQKKVSDLAFTALKLGQTSMSELSSSMQRVTSMSATLGVSQEELFAVFSSGTGVIGGAAEVSTNLSAVYTELLKPQDKLASAMQELGASSGTELIAKFGGLSGALEALKGVAEKTGEPISNLFGSSEAGKLALYAAGEGAKKFASDLEAMSDAAGAADQAFRDATEGGANAFGFQMQQLKLNAQSFGIKVGQALLPTLQTLLTPLFKGAQTLSSLNKEQLALVVSTGKVIVSITAVTAAVFGAQKAIIAAKTAMIALNGALAANPIGVFIIAVTAAIVAVKELCAWLDRAAEKRFQDSLSLIKESAEQAKHTQTISSLAKEYANLAAKEKLTNEQSLKMRDLAHQINGIVGSTFTTIHTASGKTTIDVADTVSRAAVLASKKEADLKVKLESLKIYEKQAAALDKVIQAYNNKNDSALEQAGEEFEKAGGNIAALSKKNFSKLSENYKTTIDSLRQDVRETEKAIATLKDLSKESFTADEKSTEPLEAPSDNEKEGSKKKTQKQRLQDLDELFKLETALLETQNLTEKDKLAAKEKLESSHYAKRLELLNTFHKENTAANLEENAKRNLTLEQSLEKAVGSANETIRKETENTYAELDRLSDERHKKEVERIKQTAQETKRNVEEEIALKKELGSIEGKNDKEKQRNAYLQEAAAYAQKQNELTSEYVKLSGSANEKDKEKAQAIKEQVKELKNLEDNANKSAASVESSFAQMAAKISEKMQQIGQMVEQTFSSIAEAAKSIINNKEIERKQQVNVRLAELEQEKNEKLLELDNELSDLREQKQEEDAEREEARREEEYEKRIAESERTISELSGRLQNETNLEKLRNTEKQLEDARRRKAEDEARKKEDDDKRKRDKEARMQEVALLNAKAQSEHEFALARIQTENASGDAAAKAAQETAKWQKTQGVISMAIKAAMATAEAAIEFAKPYGIGIPSGIMYTAAAVMAGVQGGIIASQPAPPDYIQQPLPPAPRPIKFASGGIALPQSGGVPFTLPSGSPGIAAEAGSPELILPVTLPNLQKMFSAAGFNQTDNSRSMSYAPTYNVEISQNQGEDLGSVVLRALEDHGREVLNIVEDNRKAWFVGD